jgi:hypothetical protein
MLERRTGIDTKLKPGIRPRGIKVSSIEAVSKKRPRMVINIDELAKYPSLTHVGLQSNRRKVQVDSGVTTVKIKLKNSVAAIPLSAIILLGPAGLASNTILLAAQTMGITPVSSGADDDGMALASGRAEVYGL